MTTINPACAEDKNGRYISVVIVVHEGIGGLFVSESTFVRAIDALAHAKLAIDGGAYKRWRYFGLEG